MSSSSRLLAMPPLHIPLLALLLLALAVSTSLSVRHEAPAPQAGYALAGSVPAAQTTPYGSGAALRNLLF